ncbi:FG-GAP repeat domain-containing protein [Streptomyces sp. NPDC059467]|uniref:FG-GAP repeat domain-containing protein n=1 Tax=Streptomyces sp. NPDC059467 TaxID=3346844 RepID=UPI0036957474
MGTVDQAHDLADDLHPNDAGYVEMAENFIGGVVFAAAQHWLVPPVAGSPGDNGAGVPAPGCQTGTNGWSAIGQIASGVGEPASRIRFADYNGDGRDDYWVLHDDGSVDVWLNTGTSNWTALGQVAPGMGQPAGKVRFADFNGDGKADYLVLNDNGSVDVWLNTGTTVWTSLGQMASGVGQPASRIRFADYNGDGKTDYLVIYDNGSVDAWLNTGTPTGRKSGR